MTILTVIQDACAELKLPRPSTVIGNTDENVVLLLALARRAGRELRSKHDWSRLNKEHTFTTSDGVDAYALPADFDYEIFSTHWDRTNSWRLRGPLSPEQWQERKSGLTTALPHLGFRIKGYSSTTFYVEPTPSAALTLVYEYQTRSWILPVAYSTATVFLAETYCSYNGVIYYTSAGGTTNGASPTADVSVTWTAYTSPYERFLADTDVSQIGEDVLTLEVIWRWKRANRFDFEDLKQEAIEAAQRAYTSQRSAPDIKMGRHYSSSLIGWKSIPDGNFGS